MGSWSALTPRAARRLAVPAALLAVLAGCQRQRPARAVLADGQELEVGCACTTVGTYVPPEVAAPAAESERFTVQASLSGQLVNLTVKRAADQSTAFTTSIPQQAAWGFSPDGDRFFYTYLSTPVQYTFLVDLTAASPRQVQIGAVAPSSSATVFSPRGRFFLHAYMQQGDTVSLSVFDAASGRSVHATSFAFTPPPGWDSDSLDAAGWGFAPDGETLVYAWGQGASAQLVMVNLVEARRVLTAAPAAGASWGFSRCGDAFALDTASPASTRATLYATRTGLELGSSAVPRAATVTHTSTETAHLAAFSGSSSTYQLAPNAAGTPCTLPVQLDALALSSTSVVGDATVIGTVTLSGPAPAGDAIVQLTASNAAATVPASVRVPAGARTVRFNVTAHRVGSATTVLVGGSHGGATRSASLEVRPPPPPPPRPVTGLALSDARLVGGVAATGTVTLAGGTTATTVALASDVPSLAAVPDAVLVSSGATAGAFAIATRPVAVPVAVTITATSGESSRSVQLELTPPAAVQAHAVIDDAGCRANQLPAGDDVSSGAVALPFALDFFGTRYTALYVNTNGNVTFGSPMADYTPYAGCSATTPPALKAGQGLTEFSLPYGNSQPNGITAGADGNLWFVELYSSRIGRLTPAGELTEFSPFPYSIGAPLSIARGADGNVWFTVTTGSQIGRLTPAGEYTSFQAPHWVNEIAGGVDGNLWFTEYTWQEGVGTTWVSRITPQGEITEFTVPSVVETYGITSGPDGALWFTTWSPNGIGRITVGGAVSLFPIPSGARITLIAAGADGNLWFTEGDANAIGRITPAGVVTEFPVPTPYATPYGITAGPDGNLWFTEQYGDAIGRITPAGVITEFPIPYVWPRPEPRRITTGPDGNLWFTETGASRIGRFTPPAAQ